MRVGTLCQPDEINERLSQGFEFIELLSSLHSFQYFQDHSFPQIDVPLIWQSPDDLPAEYPDPQIQQAVLETWRNHLSIASQIGAVLMVVQFRRPATLLNKTILIDQYIRLLNPLTSEARAAGVQLVLRNSPDNRDQLQLLREIVRQVAGLGVALDIAYAQNGVVKNLASEYIWDSDLGKRLAHIYVSDSTGRDSELRLPLGSTGEPDWLRLVSLLRERYNGSITIDVGHAAPEYLELSRQKWLEWWAR